MTWSTCTMRHYEDVPNVRRNDEDDDDDEDDNHGGGSGGGGVRSIYKHLHARSCTCMRAGVHEMHARVCTRPRAHRHCTHYLMAPTYVFAVNRSLREQSQGRSDGSASLVLFLSPDLLFISFLPSPPPLSLSLLFSLAYHQCQHD